MHEINKLSALFLRAGHGCIILKHGMCGDELNSIFSAQLYYKHLGVGFISENRDAVVRNSSFGSEILALSLL
jgi:hypothetical protein